MPPRVVQLMRGKGKGRWETPPTAPQATATPQSRSGRGQSDPQCHHGGPQEAPELPQCPWSPRCPPVVQGFKEGSHGQCRGTPPSLGGYRMTQGGRLLVIFSRGSPLRALRMASISCGDTAGEGSQAGLGSTWTHTGDRDRSQPQRGTAPLPQQDLQRVLAGWQEGKRLQRVTKQGHHGQTLSQEGLTANQTPPAQPG